MKHLTPATLALYAGNDLGPWARWRARRHLAACSECRNQVAEFSDLRQEIAGLGDLSGLPWNRLAAEMKANIRLGLAAGECIRDTRTQTHPVFAGARALIACASVALLLLAGVWLERPAPVVHAAGVSLRATDTGVELREGERAFVLKNASSRNVTYTAGAQGSIGVRFVDPNTGYVTINTVYVQ